MGHGRTIVRGIEKHTPQKAIALATEVAQELGETPPIINDDSYNIQLPDNLLYPGGSLGRIMEYTERCNVVSHPLFDLAGAICLLGTVAGQQVCTTGNLRTNVYCIIIGRSGSGKESPVRAINYLAATEILSRFKGLSCLASGAAVLTLLKSCSVRLLTLDEFGKLLNSAERQNGALYDFTRLLMELYTKTAGTYDKHYADERKSFEIIGPHLSLFGSSTPNEFYEALDVKDITSGLLARCFLFPSEHPPKKKKPDVDIETDREELQRELEMIAAINNPNFTATQNELKPVVIQPSKEADKLINKFNDLCHKKNNASYKDDVANPIYARLFEHGMKLSLIHAVSRCGADVVKDKIKPVDCDWGFQLAEAMAEWMVAQSPKNFTGADKFSKDKKKLIGLLKRFHGTGEARVSKTKLLQHMNMPVNTLAPLLDTLVQAQEIEAFTSKGSNGKPTTAYRLLRG